jgi:hydroxypyruvate reductase
MFLLPMNQRPADDPRDLLLRMFHAAIDAAAPALCVPAHLPPPPAGRTVVVGAGKASAAMAAALEAHWPADLPLSGLVVTRYGHEVPCQRIEIVQASHPVPDAAGLQAAHRILHMVQGLTADDLVIALISGGGSALLSVPAPGIDFAEKQAVNRALLRSGAPIDEMNCVRKHLSVIKGGRLAAAAYPAPVVTLTISDVPGDDPAVIASGPTVADASTSAQAAAILDKYGIAVGEQVRAWLAGPHAETIKPGDPRLAHARISMIATPMRSLEAAAEIARQAGFTPVILGDAIEGEARDVAQAQAALARQTTGPTVLLSGGETTVTVRGHGRGGRNAEFLLALGVALNGHPGIHALAGDTDGIDGTEDNAGAVLAPDFLARCAAAGLDAGAELANNNGYGVFAALNDLVLTGPTLTNVNDFRAILVLP